MHRNLSILALVGAALFFACGDSGSGESLSKPSAGASGGGQAGSSQAGSSPTGGSGGISTGAGGSSGGSGGTNGGSGGIAGGSGGAAAGTGGGGVLETTDELCSDGKDNDSNGFADCEDFNCATTPGLTVCNQSGGNGGSSGSGGSSSGENTAALCTDGQDNDGDKFTDCDDFNCCDLIDCKAKFPESSCAQKGSGGSPGTSENTVELCSDGKDNDGDKYIDCDDFNCCDLIDCKAKFPESSCAQK
ncbi:MAG: hypothetical protein NZX77_18200, partial [Polyangiaceae bacterium]|nr:hypothetical protein [Polyangiaceae bacterium]